MWASKNSEVILYNSYGKGNRHFFVIYRLCCLGVLTCQCTFVENFLFTALNQSWMSFSTEEE